MGVSSSGVSLLRISPEVGQSQEGVRKAGAYVWQQESRRKGGGTGSRKECLGEDNMQLRDTGGTDSFVKGVPPCV